jgi:hypothetical protein
VFGQRLLEAMKMRRLIAGDDAVKLKIMAQIMVCLARLSREATVKQLPFGTSSFALFPPRCWGILPLEPVKYSRRLPRLADFRHD